MPSPTWVDLIGFMASLTVFASFSMNKIVPLRAFALLSNILFLSYGFIDQIYPVFFLHTILLPINLVKLYRIYRDVPSSSTSDADAAPQDFVIRRRGCQQNPSIRMIAFTSVWRETMPAKGVFPV